MLSIYQTRFMDLTKVFIGQASVFIFIKFFY